MRALVLVSLTSCGAASCTYHAAIGGMAAVRTDGTTAGERVGDGSLALLAGAGPCLRWPRLRTSLTLDVARRGASTSVLAASETMWIFDEGHRRNADGLYRTSLALKGRLAGGHNFVTDRSIAEIGIGLAAVVDSEQYRRAYFVREKVLTGDFHAVSIDFIATYAADRQSEDEVWLGAQLAFHMNGLSIPNGSGGRRVGSGYKKPDPGESTDCNGGHLP